MNTLESKAKLTPAKWVVFTGIGWVIGFIFVLFIAEPLEKIGISVLAIGCGISAGISFMQWILLRKLIVHAARWILFSVLGFGAVFFVLNILQIFLSSLNIDFMQRDLDFLIPVMAGSVAGGYLSGYLQEKYILSKVSASSKKWAMTSMLSWVFADLLLAGFVIASKLIRFEKGAYGPLPAILFFICIGIVLGLSSMKKIASIVDAFRR